MREGAVGLPALHSAFNKAGAGRPTAPLRGMTRIDNKPLFRPTGSARIAAMHERADSLRQSLTHSERLLWAEIRGRRLGPTFKRQRPLLGRFIVAFVAPSARLIVEIDGGYHVERARQDLHRDRVLGRAGYRVLRVQSVLVERDMRAALAAIRVALRR
jgi:very-short-patch-repair endonuclease